MQAPQPLYDASHNRSRPITAYSSSSLFSLAMNSEFLWPPGSPRGDADGRAPPRGDGCFGRGADTGSDGAAATWPAPRPRRSSRRCDLCAPVDGAPCPPESAASAWPVRCDAVIAERARFGTQTRLPSRPLMKSECSEAAASGPAASAPPASATPRLRFPACSTSSKATCMHSALATRTAEETGHRRDGHKPLQRQEADSALVRHAPCEPSPPGASSSGLRQANVLQQSGASHASRPRCSVPESACTGQPGTLAQQGAHERGCAGARLSQPGALLLRTLP